MRGCSNSTTHQAAHGELLRYEAAIEQYSSFTAKMGTVH